MNALLNRVPRRPNPRTDRETFAWLRVLNGAPLIGAHAGFLAGFDTLAAVLADPDHEAFVRGALFAEVLPTIAVAEAKKRARAESLLVKLGASPAPDLLASIAVRPASQWRDRVMPSLLDYHRSRGTVPPALAFSLAALVSFCRGRVDSATELEGTRGGKPYRICDDARVVGFFADAWANLDLNGDWYALAYATLGNTELWGDDLNRIRGLAGTMAEDLATIAMSGMASAVASLNAARP